MNGILFSLGYLFGIFLVFLIVPPVTLGLVVLEKVTGSDIIGACRQDMTDVLKETFDRFLNHIYYDVLGVSPEKACPIGEIITERVERW